MDLVCELRSDANVLDSPGMRRVHLQYEYDEGCQCRQFQTWTIQRLWPSSS
jgi:hypothetical protein